MMNLMLKSLFAGLLAFGTLPACAALNILACEPEWGALARELAGDKARVYTATNALQDPHHIEAKPSLLARARNADLLVCTGAELEIGWLPILVQQAGNPKIQPGQLGYFAAADYVRLLEIPTRLDRAEGDLHPSGNPHIQTDPRNIAAVAQALAQRLTAIDPDNSEYYGGHYTQFAAQWQTAIATWEQHTAPLRGTTIVVQHRGFAYLENWLGLKQIAALEPKPGVEPSGAHLAAVMAQIQRQPARMVIRAAYSDGRASAWLAERAHIPEVVLPFTVGGSTQADNLFSLFDDTVQRLLHPEL